MESRTTFDRIADLRLNPRASLLIGLASAGFALAYLLRATSHGGFLNWAFVALLGAFALLHMAIPVLPARAPSVPKPRAIKKSAAKPAPKRVEKVIETTDDTGPVARVAPPVVDPVEAVRAARDVARQDEVSTAAPRVAVPAEFQPYRVEHVEVSSVGAVVVEHLIDDEAPAVANPVIGPQLRRARERAGLSIDDLSDRTMIRPHVLEAIERDNFMLCGGDFYARGHLRTLAHFLAIDGPALVALYDQRYSAAPINARRVFEAELAANLGTGFTARSRGPRWSLIAAAVLGLLMVWGVARYFSVAPAPIAGPATSATAGLAANQTPVTSSLAKPQTLIVSATKEAVDVVVRDRQGALVWRGHLDKAQQQQLTGDGPFTVQTSNGQNTTVQLDGADQGAVGDGNIPATRTVGSAPS